MWKQFNDTYVVSSLGEVKNVKTNRILKTDLNSKGYGRVWLNKHRYFIHRLVAKLYIDNPDDLPQVNHIDGDKLNNSAENLEWCTNQYNNLHSYIKGGRTSGKTKISKDDLVFILKSLKDKTTSCKDLAIMYNVKTSTIYAIKQGLNCKRLNL